MNAGAVVLQVGRAVAIAVVIDHQARRKRAAGTGRTVAAIIPGSHQVEQQFPGGERLSIGEHGIGMLGLETVGIVDEWLQGRDLAAVDFGGVALERPGPGERAAPALVHPHGQSDLSGKRGQAGGERITIRKIADAVAVVVVDVTGVAEAVAVHVALAGIRNEGAIVDVAA